MISTDPAVNSPPSFAEDALTPPVELPALHADSASFRPVLTLARVEGRRLITHPIFLASPLIGIVMVGGTALPRGVAIAVLLLTGFAYFTIAEGTLLVANLSASRSRRHHTEELYATLPASPRSRTAGNLVALGWAAGLALAINLVAAGYLTAHGPIPATGDFGRTPEPFSFMLLQGPALLLLFGALGVFLARWIPTATVAPLAVVGMFVLQIPFLWTVSPFRCLAVLCFLGEEAVGPASVIGWHALYLVGLSAVLGALALLRHGRSRWSVAVLLGGVALAALGGALQVLAAA